MIMRLPSRPAEIPSRPGLPIWFLPALVAVAVVGASCAQNSDEKPTSVCDAGQYHAIGRSDCVAPADTEEAHALWWYDRLRSAAGQSHYQVSLKNWTPLKELNQLLADEPSLELYQFILYIDDGAAGHRVTVTGNDTGRDAVSSVVEQRYKGFPDPSIPMQILQAIDRDLATVSVLYIRGNSRDVRQWWETHADAVRVVRSFETDAVGLPSLEPEERVGP